MLAAAGAALAVDFVTAGWTLGDTTVLARLVGMLTDPLAAMQASQVSKTSPKSLDSFSL